MSSDEQTCHDTLMINIMSIIWCTIGEIIILVSCYKFSIAYTQDQNRNDRPSFSKTIKTLSVLFILATILTMTIVMCLIGICITDSLNVAILLNTFVGLFWCCAGLFVILVFLTRLYDVFKDTTHAYSKKTFMLLIALIVVGSLVALVGIAIFPIDFRIGLVCGLFAGSCYFIMAFTTLWLFIYGLFKVLYNTYTMKLQKHTKILQLIAI